MIYVCGRPKGVDVSRRILDGAQAWKGNVAGLTQMSVPRSERQTPTRATLKLV